MWMCIAQQNKRKNFRRKYKAKRSERHTEREMHEGKLWNIIIIIIIIVITSTILSLAEKHRNTNRKGYSVIIIMIVMMRMREEEKKENCSFSVFAYSAMLYVSSYAYYYDASLCFWCSYHIIQSVVCLSWLLSMFIMFHHITSKKNRLLYREIAWCVGDA